MRTPMRVVEPGTAVAVEPDMRTWWGRNAKAIGVILGTAGLTILTGAGGMTGLARLAGLATATELASVNAKIAAVEGHQQTSSKVDEDRFTKQDVKLDALLKAVAALRADLSKRTKKPAAPAPAAP